MPEPSKEKFPALAMVALNDQNLPSIENITSELKSIWPKCPAVTNVSVDKSLILFQLKDELVNIGLVEAPIPWSAIEGPCATAWWWPEAASKMKPHKFHLLVFLRNEKGDNIDQCMLLSRITAAVAKASNSAGVYWGNGTLVYPTDFLLAGVQEMTRDNLPLELWIDYRIEKQSNGNLLAFTTGLLAFGLQELEIHNSSKSPKEVMHFIRGISDYLMDNGPVLKHGQTIGFSATQKVPIRHGPSHWNKNKTVIILDF